MKRTRYYVHYDFDDDGRCVADLMKSKASFYRETPAKAIADFRQICSRNAAYHEKLALQWKRAECVTVRR